MYHRTTKLNFTSQKRLLRLWLLVCRAPGMTWASTVYIYHEPTRARGSMEAMRHKTILAPLGRATQHGPSHTSSGLQILYLATYCCSYGM